MGTTPEFGTLASHPVFNTGAPFSCGSFTNLTRFSPKLVSISPRAELAGLLDMSQPHPLACGGSQSALSRSRVDSLARFHRARPRHGRDLGSGVPGGSRRARRPLYPTFLRRSRQAGGCITRPGMGSLTTMCATGCHRSGYMAPNCGDHAAPFTGTLPDGYPAVGYGRILEPPMYDRVPAGCSAEQAQAGSNPAVSTFTPAGLATDGVSPCPPSAGVGSTGLAATDPWPLIRIVIGAGQPFLSLTPTAIGKVGSRGPTNQRGTTINTMRKQTTWPRVRGVEEHSAPAA